MEEEKDRHEIPKSLTWKFWEIFLNFIRGNSLMHIEIETSDKKIMDIFLAQLVVLAKDMFLPLGKLG